MIGDLCHLELVESPDLPGRTVVAPLLIVREMRSALGKVDLNILVGKGESVLISSDLYEAFSVWTANLQEEQDDQATDETDVAGLN